MCIASIWSDLWVLPAIFVPLLAVAGLLAINLDPTCALAFRGWCQRQILWYLKKRLPAQVARERQELLAAWDTNPASRCAAIFNRFNNPTGKVRLEQLANIVDSAIENGLDLFEDDFLSRYGNLFDSLLVVRTAEIAKSLAAQQPMNAAFVIQKLAQNDDELFQKFGAPIRQALADGRRDFGVIRAHLEQLRENSGRFRRILVPGLLSQFSTVIVGALTGATLGAVGINSDFIIKKAAQFTAGKWADWRGKSDEEFGDKFVQALEEVQIVCEHMDAAVRRSLTAALDMYLEHRLRHQEATLSALSDLSRARWDVGSSIAYFRASLPKTKRRSERRTKATPAALSSDSATSFIVVILTLVAGGLFWFFWIRPERGDDAIRTSAAVTPAPLPERQLGSTAPTTSAIVTIPTQNPRFATVLEAQRAAVLLYPELGVADSILNKAFVAEVNRRKQTTPDFFRQTDWPMQLANEMASNAKEAEEERLRTEAATANDKTNNERRRAEVRQQQSNEPKEVLNSEPSSSSPHNRSVNDHVPFVIGVCLGAVFLLLLLSNSGKKPKANYSFYYAFIIIIAIALAIMLAPFLSESNSSSGGGAALEADRRELASEGASLVAEMKDANRRHLSRDSYEVKDIRRRREDWHRRAAEHFGKRGLTPPPMIGE